MINFIVQFVVALVATISFALLFHVPRTEFLYCGITGGAGWIFYVLAMQWQSSNVVASLIAVIVLAIMARIFAVFRCCPVTVYLICGIFPLVPGAGIYYTAYHFIMGEMELFSAKAMETFKIAVAIALGIVLILSLPGGIFKIFSPRNCKTRKIN